MLAYFCGFMTHTNYLQVNNISLDMLYYWYFPPPCMSSCQRSLCMPLAILLWTISIKTILQDYNFCRKSVSCHSFWQFTLSRKSTIFYNALHQYNIQHISMSVALEYQLHPFDIMGDFHPQSSQVKNRGAPKTSYNVIHCIEKLYNVCSIISKDYFKFV